MKPRFFASRLGKALLWSALIIPIFAVGSALDAAGDGATPADSESVSNKIRNNFYISR